MEKGNSNIYLSSKDEKIAPASAKEVIPVPNPIKKVNFYYDGFNFYRGLKEANWQKFYWLNIVEFSRKLIGKYDGWELNKTNYYTAKPYGKDKALRQQMFIFANQKLTSGIFDVKWGQYGERNITCLKTCKESFKIPLEKGADVGIAVDIVTDCILGNCDVTVLVSGDNDQIPTLKFIKNHNPNHKVLVFFPPHRNLNSLQPHCYKSSHLLTSPHLFETSVMPRKLTLPDGSWTMRPPEWPGLTPST